MSDYDQFEHSLSKKFEDFRPDSDDNKIWATIAPQLPSRKKERRVFWLCLFGLVTIALVVSAYFISNPTDVNVVSEPIIKKQNEHIVESNQSQNTNKTTELDKKSTAAIVPSHMSTKTQKKTKNAIGSSQINIQPIEKTNSSTLNNVASTEINKFELTNNEIESITLSKETHKNSITQLAPRTYSMFSLESLSKIDPQQLNYSREINTYPELSKIEPVFTDKKIGRKQSIGFNLSYFKPFANYANNVNSEPGYASSRQEMEETLEAIQGQIDYRIMLNQHWSVSLGLSYWSMQESLSYSSLTQQPETQDAVTGVINFPNGSQEFITSSVLVNQNQVRHFTRYNRYQSFAIPLRIGYDSKISDRIIFGVYVGLEKAIANNISGFELNTDESEYILDDDVNQRYKNIMGDYLLCGAKIETYVGSHWSLSLSLDYKNGLNTITTQNALIDKKYNFLGISLGTNYLF